MRGIRPPALFELRAHVLAACKGWRNAVDLRHTPVSRSALVSTEGPCGLPPGSLVRLTFQIGPRDRVDLHLQPFRLERSAWQDLHLQPFRLERNASALGYTRWCSRSELH
jgi:hypothetical protein